MATISKEGLCQLAASFLTTQRQAEVAADYLDWINDQVIEQEAIDALAATCRSSKNPTKVLANAAAYYDAGDVVPTIATTDPATGAAAGGTAITITGLNFTGATAAAVGGVAITSRVVVSDTEITGVTGAHAAGLVNVTVTTPGGTATQTGGFTYV